MRRFLALTSSLLTGLVVAAGLALAAAPGVINQYNAICNPDFPTRCIKPDVNGATPVTVTSSAGSPVVVTGSGVAGTPATGVVSVQGVAGGTAVPVAITGTPAVSQSGTWTVQQGTPPWGVIGTQGTGDGASAGLLAVRTYSVGGVLNGSGTIDISRGAVNGLNSAGVGLPAAQVVGQCDDASQTAITENQFGNARIDCVTHAQMVEALPSSSAAIGIAATANAALNTGSVLKASPGNLYDVEASTTTVAGYLVVLDLTGVPGAGPIVPKAHCYIPAPGTCALDFDPPLTLGTGIVVVLTTAATPYTFTSPGATVAFSGRVQ